MFVHHLRVRPPLLQSSWFERPLVKLVAEHGGVVSVVAGPGYGKTVLAAQVYAAHRGPKLWYGFDAADCDLAVFATHFDTVLRSLGRAPQLEGENWRLGSTKEIASIFAGAFAEIEALPLLVFDDVHLIEHSRSLDVLSDFVSRLAHAGATVVLCARSMPLPLHAYAAAGRLMQACAADLAFDVAQARRYLQRSTRGACDERAADDLIRLAEGWPAGLALIGSTGVAFDRNARPGTCAGGEEARQLLFDYLAAEVFGSMDEGERRFLLETSILEELETGVCAELTGSADAARMLRSFSSRGLFITRRSETAFSAHRLFHDFLRAEFFREYPADDRARFQRLAAEAYRSRGDVVSATRHRLAAGDYDTAIAELESVAFPLVASGRLSPLRDFLAQLGRERTEASPTLLAAQGRLQQIRGEWDDALVSLERAMTRATERADYAVLAEAARAIAPILASRGEFGRLDALLAQTLTQPIPEAGRTALLSTQGAVYVETERYDDAVRLFAEIMPAIVARGDLALQGMVLHNTGAAHVRRGDPYAGLAFYERALRVKRSAGQRVSALVTLANRIFAMVLVGDLLEAERFVADLLEESADLDNATMQAYGHQHYAEIALSRGDVSAALAAFEKARGLCDPGDVLVLPEVLHGYSRALLERGDVEAADELCARAMKLMRTVGRSQPLAAVLLTRACCAFARADHDRGVALVEESFELANSGDDALLRAYVNLDAAALLVRISSDMPHSAKRARLDELARAATETALSLMEQRDYRFLLRTRAAAFATLHEPRLRWAAERDLPGDGSETPAALRIEMLGGLRVTVRGEAIPAKAWTRRKARDLFAHLVTLRGRACSRSRLVDLYWPELEGDAAHDALRVTVSAIRKAVGNVIKFEDGGYRFVAPAGTAFDVEEFERAIEAARSAEAHGTLDAAHAAFLRAVTVYRGDFLEGAEDAAWLWRERDRLRKPYLAALRWLVRHPSDELERNVELLDRLLDETPFDVEAVKLRLDGMTGESRARDAAAEYERWKAAYRATVGSEAPEIWLPPALAPC